MWFHLKKRLGRAGRFMRSRQSNLQTELRRKRPDKKYMIFHLNGAAKDEVPIAHVEV